MLSMLKRISAFSGKTIQEYQLLKNFLWLRQQTTVWRKQTVRIGQSIIYGVMVYKFTIDAIGAFVYLQGQSIDFAAVRKSFT